MQAIFSPLSPFVVLHAYRETTENQEVILGIAVIFNSFLKISRMPLLIVLLLQNSLIIILLLHYLQHKFPFCYSDIVPSKAFALSDSFLLIPHSWNSWHFIGSATVKWIRSLQTWYQLSLLYYLVHQSPSNHSLMYYHHHPLQKHFYFNLCEDFNIFSLLWGYAVSQFLMFLSWFACVWPTLQGPWGKLCVHLLVCTMLRIHSPVTP